MKKIAIAVAVLGTLAGSVQAQSNVTLYGIADGGMRFDHTSIGTLKSVYSGAQDGSRWGLQGKEDLGNGYKATIQLEQGFNLTDNSVPQGNVGTPASAVGGLSAPASSSGSRFFSRRSTVGFAGDFGEIRFGHDYSPIFVNWALTDPTGSGMIGESGSLFQKSPTRYDAALFYISPFMSGVQFNVAYQAGKSTTNKLTVSPTAPNAATSGDASDGNRFGFNAIFTNGTFLVGYGYSNGKHAVNAPTIGFSGNNSTKLNNLVGTYNFGVVKMVAQYWKAKDDLGYDSSTWYLGGTVPVQNWRLIAGYSKLTDKGQTYLLTSAVNLVIPTKGEDAALMNIGAYYDFSKRTTFYGGYAAVRNKGHLLTYVPIDATGAGLYNATGSGVNLTPGAVSNPSSLEFGMSHKF